MPSPAPRAASGAVSETVPLEIIKVCGITNPEDAVFAATHGATAIGMIFFSGSPRCVSVPQAARISAALPSGVSRVGVFVNESPEMILKITAEARLDIAQLHGDEPPEFLREIRPLPIMRVVRMQNDLSPLDAYLAACHRLVAMPRMLLVDARRGDQFGGTGITVDWDLLAKNRQRFRGMPLVLAGGLTAENVSAAIATVRPWAVDVASGVEIAPAAKSPELVGRFVCAAKKAFHQLTAPT